MLSEKNMALRRFSLEYFFTEGRREALGFEVTPTMVSLLYAHYLRSWGDVYQRHYGFGICAGEVVSESLTFGRGDNKLTELRIYKGDCSAPSWRWERERLAGEFTGTFPDWIAEDLTGVKRRSVEVLEKIARAARLEGKPYARREALKDLKGLVASLQFA